MESMPSPENSHTENGGKIRRRPATALRILLPLTVLGLGLSLSLWLMETGPQAKPRPKTRNATLVEVRPIAFGPQKTPVFAMGTVRPSREVLLKPQVSGEITEVAENFIPGGHFRNSETLLKIDPTDYRLAVRQLASDVARVESELQMEQGNQLVAQKEYELLGETVSAEEKALMLRRPQLDVLHASLEAAQAKLEQARIDLQRTEITAPFNSVVNYREVNIGTRVNEGTALAMLIGTDAYWVEVSVPVNQLRWINIPQAEEEEGSAVRVYDQAAWGHDAFRRGRVIRLTAALEEQGRMARLLVEVPDPLALEPKNAGRPKMLIDSYVRLEIEGRDLPSAAVIDREMLRDGDTLWIMDKEGRLDIRKVDIAFRGRDHVLVTDGVGDGERLVVSPLSAPVPGMALRLPEETAETALAKDEGKGGGPEKSVKP